MDEYEIEHNFGFLVNDLTRLITTKFNTVMEPVGLTRSQWRVVVNLHRQDGLSQSELAELLSVGKVTIGGLVDRLEHAGWVRRKDDPNDGRTKRVYLTKKGRAIENDMVAKGGELSRRILRSLSPEEQESLIDMLIAVKNDLLEMDDDVDKKKPRSNVIAIKESR